MWAILLGVGLLFAALALGLCRAASRVPPGPRMAADYEREAAEWDAWYERHGERGA